ncbi:asparaginyl-tRNA synthetase [Dichomitus squalens LYAD-421 SS1]|uniref:asparaginyl-tRNA synthetase n=1 Tax=Dichomitus squalens (strain LYAD-421) TaxID=732165 RepID=UPI00044132AB|nr:asparaginyl-tRNA synthetase [Dichomitus squalens LYAD-421 SS1]EJF65820.1 asparaginyl-tRNA synthetase [Dichomitus squalens LYAD-421 SS1]
MLARRFLSTSASLPPTIRQLLAAPPSTYAPAIHVNGWVKSIRRQKKVAFAVITDGSSEPGLQAVFTDINLAKQLTNGASVKLRGELVDSRGAGQAKELQVAEAEVLGECDPETYPMQKQALTVEYLRDHCHLRARTREIGAMLRLRDSTTRAIHNYFEDIGFIHVHTPIITSNDCEGAGETFRIAPSSSEPSSRSASPPSSDAKPSDYFNHPAYLTVSSQLHLEAVATALSRVYTLSPCFRAERSQTSRHLAEFWMLEAEWAFTSSLDELCTVVENAIRHVLRTHSTSPDMDALWKQHPSATAQARRDELHSYASASRPWTRLTYTDAINILSAHHAATGAFVFPPVWGSGLQSEHERWLAEQHARGPVFVTDYPAAMKPFYMRMNDGCAPDRQTAACFDLLVPGMGELVGGSLREERAGLLEKALERHGLDKSDYGWYLDLRRYGGAPHGGFGLGFERLISWMSGIESVRECIAMPRWVGRMLL